MAKNEQKDQEKPKIVADDDWKAQAKAEKEKLAKEVEARDKQAPSEEHAKPSPQARPREIPPASFTTLVSSLMTQILLALGGYEDPKTKKRYMDLDLAKHHIDTLAVLEKKTKGNLTEEETKLLDRTLYETRMQYVQIAQRVS
ncbi:MAG: DUF1844 domain-containing protein [Phycisphaerae bacterium]|nr:DUF1844 domain-containing protein [Phycisphaerae bacterium]